MLKCKRLVWLFFIVLSFFVVQSVVMAQLKCMFISETADPDPRDVALVNLLQMKYTVDIATGDDVKAEFYFLEDFQAYDFLFVSESVSSSDTRPLKGAPVPIFYTELFSAKWDVTGWVMDNNSSGTYYGSVAEDGKVTIVDGDHPLAAGFATNTEVDIVTGSSSTDYLTFSVPHVDFIQIGVLTADPTQTIIMGVEAGTILYNAEGVIDGSLTSTSRCAGVGIHADANAMITMDGFKLIQAGIDWILGETGVEHDDIDNIFKFQLNQNYPNPFNPETEISFRLDYPGHIELKVYNMKGQIVATLINEYMEPGIHRLIFDAGDLSSGVYIYQIKSKESIQMKKMVLLK
jgi:hypothetical protein